MRRQSELKKKGLAVLLSVALAAASFSGCGMKDVSKNIKSEVTAEAAVSTEADELEKDIASMIHSASAGKSETVYVIKDADGNKKQVLVSEWLKNPDGKAQINDVTNLKDIEVVKGDASYTEGADGKITWNGNGSDIYYRGSSEKALPVDVDVRYYLNDKLVAADELNGASGHLKIEFIYKNNTEKTVEGVTGEYKVYQPFLMVSGMILSNDKATDVKVSGGSAVNDGDRTIIFGMGFPGLSESLGLNNLEIAGEKLDIGLPESVSVECEINNFSKPVTLTIATNAALDELELTNIEGSQLGLKFMELKNGVNQLVDGSKALADGMSSLNDGSKTLSDGVDKLKDGADALSKGAGDLSDGAAKLDDGAKALLKGMTDLDKGAATLEWGLKTMQEKLPALSSGTSALVKGAKDLSDGAKLLTSNNKKLNDGATALYTGLRTLNTSLNSEDAKKKLTALAKGNGDFKKGLDDFNTGISQMAAGYDYTKMGYSKEQLQGLATYLTNYAQAIAETDAVSSGYIAAAAQLVNGYVSMYDNLAKLSAGSAQLDESYAQIYAGVNTLIGQIRQIAASSPALEKGALDLKNGISDYTNGAQNISDGAKQLSDGTSKLSGSLPDLKKGVDDLTSGAGSLRNGADQLKDGAKQLSDGTGDLSTGSKALKEGADALDKGIGDMKNGSKDLIEGIGKLLDGSVALRDGVLKLNDEGIEKLTNFVKENLAVYSERFDELKEYSKEFGSFAGAEDGVSCNTVFVFKTE
ncbi:MAG: hypothetical protein IJM14_10620 [Lachnospiraceae bacterium]|nr:hypothetical protein [Lachnospiraceae bacterium]